MSAYPLIQHSSYLIPSSQETRGKVLRRVLSLIDAVLGLEEGHLWRLHQNSKGRTGDDVSKILKRHVMILVKKNFASVTQIHDVRPTHTRRITNYEWCNAQRTHRFQLYQLPCVAAHFRSADLDAGWSLALC